MYEYRSASRDCLEKMKKMFYAVVQAYQAMGIEVKVELLASRPCRAGVDEQEQKALLKRCETIIRKYHPEGDIRKDISSSDANIPWANGIPATTIGVVECGAAHTREEWANLDSLDEGMHIAMNLILSFTCDITIQ